MILSVKKKILLEIAKGLYLKISITDYSHRVGPIFYRSKQNDIYIIYNIYNSIQIHVFVHLNVCSVNL